MTEISRRLLLRAGALGVALAPFVSAGEASAATSANLYTRARFTPLRNATFKLASVTSVWSLVLSSISDLPPAIAGDNFRFVLTFRTAVAGPPQGTFLLKRAGFTATTLFVVPSDATRRTYQAIVNRAP